jgi:hypothetical protein
MVVVVLYIRSTIDKCRRRVCKERHVPLLLPFVILVLSITAAAASAAAASVVVVMVVVVAVSSL